MIGMSHTMCQLQLLVGLGRLENYFSYETSCVAMTTQGVHSSVATSPWELYNCFAETVFSGTHGNFSLRLFVNYILVSMI